MKILSFGAGMLSTALLLMSCEKSIKEMPDLYPEVPIYDASIFCNLGLEPPWVLEQVNFARRACQKAGIPFFVLDTPLYQDFMKNFGNRRTVSIPWWTLAEDGHKARPCLKIGGMPNGERFFRQSRQIFAGGLTPGKKI